MTLLATAHRVRHQERLLRAVPLLLLGFYALRLEQRPLDPSLKLPGTVALLVAARSARVSATEDTAAAIRPSRPELDGDWRAHPPTMQARLAWRVETSVIARPCWSMSQRWAMLHGCAACSGARTATSPGT